MASNTENCEPAIDSCLLKIDFIRKSDTMIKFKYLFKTIEILE